MVLDTLRPSERHRVIDLLRDAGVDVADWSNYADGRKPAAANPKYCYEWAFVEPGTVVVVNLWYSEIRSQGGTVTAEGHMREVAAFEARPPGKSVRRDRAERFDRAIEVAWRENLPLRAIICDGRRRTRSNPEGTASRVERRLLDPVPWSVQSYDDRTGRFVLARGPLRQRLVDQFALGVEHETPAETRSVTGTVYVRSSEVRRLVLERAGGHCEWCGAEGFALPDGSVFLETHHVVPLGENGPDTVLNVVALCPNHHREAHYGATRDSMHDGLLRIPK